MSDYRRRVVDDEIDELFSALPAIALEGAKGVGKTETAQRRAATVFALDAPGPMAVVGADPERVAGRGPYPVLADEWQRVPPVWDVIRRAVDRDDAPGRFLLTGSATSNAPTHSGAGRIVTVRMRPLSLAERGLAAATVSLGDLLDGRRPVLTGDSALDLEGYVEEIVASGFPGLRHLGARPRRAQLDGYLQRIVEHDFAEQGHIVRDPAMLRRWMVAYAAATSTSASYETIRDAATGGEGDKPAKTTTQPYRDVLERLWIVDPIPAWAPTRNRISRLSAPPKHHLVDAALAARLLGASAESLLAATDLGPPVPRDGTLLGHLFESLVTASVRVYAQQAEARVGHLRTRGGAREVDLIVERDDGRVVAIEVKLSGTIGDTDVRHLHWLQGQLGDDLLDRVVVTTGSHAYRRPDGVAVVPAALLGP